MKTNTVENAKPPSVESLPESARFLDESECLRRVPVSRRTWSNWKSKGLIPFIKIGRRCLYDWRNVHQALLRMEKGGVL